MSITSKIIYKKANDFFSSSKSDCASMGCNNFVEFVLDIPIIQKICEFNVGSSMSIEKKFKTNKYVYIYKFAIVSKKLKINNKDYYRFFSYEKKNFKLSIGNTNKFIGFIQEILPKLNFNKFTGIFEFDTNKISKPINFANSETNNILETDVFNPKHTNSNECCICYDKTLIKTSCGHFLCVECWHCMKNISECPYCRHKKIKISNK
jgi:hypothetical protein